MSSPLRKNLDNSLEVIQAAYTHMAGILVFPVMMYLGSRVALTWSANVHWLLNAVLILVFSIFLAILLIGVNEKFFQKFPASTILSLFLTMVLVGASIASSISYTLYAFGFADYVSKNELHPGAFADYYIWEFIELIPALEIWETLNIEKPISSNGLVAGIPVLLYRCFIVLPVIALFKKWMESKSKNEV